MVLFEVNYLKHVIDNPKDILINLVIVIFTLRSNCPKEFIPPGYREGVVAALKVVDKSSKGRLLTLLNLVEDSGDIAHGIRVASQATRFQYWIVRTNIDRSD